MGERASLVWITPNIEPLMIYIARVSSTHQGNPSYENLLLASVRRKHWSVFEMGNMCVEINTSRGISAQAIRHRSFHFQEFSQRYAEVQEILYYPPRRQDHKNRQNTFDDLPPETLEWWKENYDAIVARVQEFYQESLRRDIGKESARWILPMSSKTRMYMNGTIRDWIFYITVRTHESAQLEHRQVAEEIKEIFCKELPVLGRALGWSK